MARSVPWRRINSDSCSWHQDEAANATIYILRTMGPTSFLLKEEGESKNFKVFLGDPHRCTCPSFMKEKDLCKHICWVLMKKFRVPRQNPVTWQLGLVEREINEILKGILTRSQPQAGANAKRLAKEAGEKEDSGGGEPGTIEQRPISEDDVCPICQDELLAKHLPVTYCKFGCGNSVHIKCMNVWADHQQKSIGDTTVKCPFCREDFGPISVLKQEFRNTSKVDRRPNEHLGTVCRNCQTCPIVGKCYKCDTCTDYHLCQTCFNTSVHSSHPFVFRQKSIQRWRPAQRGQGAALPQAVISNLMEREISDNDYDLLLQLDSGNTSQGSDLTQETVSTFPLQRVRPNSLLLAPGQQCRICLRAYQEGQFIRRLPCKHTYHHECIDNWLLHQNPTCPVDGTVYTNESVRNMREAERQRKKRTQNNEPSQTGSGVTSSDNLDLAIPGTGLVLRGATVSGHPNNGHPNNTRNRRQGIGRNLNPQVHGTPSLGISGSNFASGEMSNPVSHIADANTPQVNLNDLLETLSQASDIQSQDMALNIGGALGRNSANLGSANSRHGHRRAARPSFSHNIEIVPPSIPLPHSGITLGVQNQGLPERTPIPLGNTVLLNRKPPSGKSGNQSNGKSNKSMTPKENSARSRRNSQTIRDRSPSVERERRGSGNLFIGNDPTSANGLSATILLGMNANTQLKKAGHNSHANLKKGGRLVSSKTHEQHGEDPKYRWGNTSLMDADILLAGNAVKHLERTDST